MKNKTLSLGLACACSFFHCIQAANYYVAPGATGDGSSWENASSLNDALLKATEADTIFAAPGTYTALPDSAFTCTERNNGAVVYGSAPQGLPLPAFNTLADTASVSSKLVGNGKPVVEINNSTVKWVGFEITGGTAQMGAGVYNLGGTLQCCIVHGNTAELTKSDRGGGGGIYNTGEIRHCVVRNNTLSSAKTNAGGGGIHNTTGGVVRNSYIHSNESQQTGGGVMSVTETEAPKQSAILDCEISGNTANTMGGGIYMDSTSMKNAIIKENTLQSAKKGTGGGIYATSSSDIDACVVEGNLASSKPAAKGMHGGVSLNGRSRIQNSIIRRNLCMAEASEAGGVFGGGIGLSNGSEAINCLITENKTNGTLTASTKGGGASCNTNSKIINCTITGNSSAGRGGGVHLDNGHIANSIVWGNQNELEEDKISLDIRIDGTCSMKNTLYQYRSKKAAIDENNIACDDPLFRDAANGDYRLSMESPAVNAGLAEENPLATDLAGEQRIAAGNIDLGAYELVYFLVNLPETLEGAEIKTDDGNTAFKGESYSFSLVRDAEYDESVPVVTTDRPADGELDGGEGTDGVFHYTISDIQSDITLSVTGLTPNPMHTVTLPEAVEGWTLNPETESNEIRSGQDYRFTLTLDADYDESPIDVQVTREGTETPEALAADENGVYSITNIRSGVTLAISGVTLNPERTVTLPDAIEGLVLTAETEGTAVRSGHDFVFTLTLEADYDESALTVEVTRGDAKEALTPTDEGKYLIAGIRTDVTVAIRGVALNPERTVTLPAGLEGATLTPATAENKVRSGQDFEFTLTLDEGYDQSTPVVTIKRDGTNAETLTPDADGKYIIAEVRTDVTVEITGIEENPSKLGEIDFNVVRIYTANRTLHVEAADADITIYTLDGIQWTTAQVNGTAEFDLPAGTYIVRHGNRAAQVPVR